MVKSPLCSLCNQASESVLHLFCTCTNARIWPVNPNVALPSNLEPQLTILGLWNELMQDFTPFNHVILMLSFIFTVRKTKGPVQSSLIRRRSVY